MDGSALIPLAAALAGAVVGAGINGGFGRRAERRRWEREDDRRAAEVLVAARLVFAELDYDEALLDVALESGSARPVKSMFGHAWRAQAPLLAADLPESVFETLAGAYASIDAQFNLLPSAEAQLDPASIADVRETRSVVADAKRILGDFTSG